MKSRLWLRARWIAGTTLLITSSAGAQSAPGVIAAPDAAEHPTIPVALRIHRPLNIPGCRVSIRDAFATVERVSHVRIRAEWADERHPESPSPELLVDLAADHAPLIRVVESLLRQCDPQAGGGVTWQFADDGAIEVATRARLNEHRSTRIYDVRDLLATLPDFTQGATLDLQAALQSASGGGSVIRDDAGRIDMGADARPDRARELLDLITQTIEPDQWAENGGTAATIRLFQNQLIIAGPGYLHRQILAQSAPSRAD